MDPAKPKKPGAYFNFTAMEPEPLPSFLATNVKTAAKPLTQKEFYEALVMAPPPEFPPAPSFYKDNDTLDTPLFTPAEGRCVVCHLYEDEDGANHYVPGEIPPYGWNPKPGIHGAHYFAAAMSAEAMAEKVKQELIAHIEKHVIGQKTWNDKTFSELQHAVWEKSGGRLTLKNVAVNQSVYGGTEVEVELVEAGVSEMMLAFPMKPPAPVFPTQSYPMGAKDYANASDVIAWVTKEFGAHFEKKED